MPTPRLPLLRLAAACACSLALSGLPAAAATPAAGPAAVAWIPAAADADIDTAFAQARAQKKPVLLYWGATWCPPCNQLKATLFNRADFIERSRSVVAVHVDGDKPGAQKLGARFKVRGYPTMVLLAPDGSELTRLPGEVEPAQVLALLQQAMAGGRPAKAVLADARAGRPLQPAEWRLLAFYGWDIDADALLPATERPEVLALLARACPPAEAEAATRLLLKALAARSEHKGLKPEPAHRERVLALLARPTAVRAQVDVLANQSDDIVRALAPQPGPERQALVQALDAALQGLEADATLSRADRLGVLAARVAVARIDQPADALQPTLPAALRERVKAQVARDDAEIRDGYERQAVITGGAWLLTQAGLWTESDALLKANLARSHSAYYLMSQLAGNARKQGRTDEALRWYEEAFQKSVGPATRLQWGASYLGALVELAPKDAARIERVAAQLIQEAAADGGAFAERSARSMQRVGQRLADWNRGGEHGAVLKRLVAGPQGLATVCGKVEASNGQRSACEALARQLEQAAGKAA